MPNYVSNVINVTGDSKVMSKMLRYIKGDDGCFDFNKIVPMPKTLKIVESSGSIDALKLIMFEKNDKLMWSEDMKKEHARIVKRYPAGPLSDNLDYLFDMQSSPKTIEDARYLGKLMEKNIKKYGAKTWYDWSIKYWGTKWNACEAKIEKVADGGVCIKFDTAWSAPMQIFTVLTEKFPTLNWEGYFSDEDLRSENHGYWTSNCEPENVTKKDIIITCWGKAQYEELVTEDKDSAE